VLGKRRPKNKRSNEGFERPRKSLAKKKKRRKIRVSYGPRELVKRPKPRGGGTSKKERGRGKPGTVVENHEGEPGKGEKAGGAAECGCAGPKKNGWVKPG